MEHIENTGLMPGAGLAADTGIDVILGEMRQLSERNGQLQGYLDRIFGITSAIIYILDAGGRFTFVNRGVEEILNFSPGELIGKHFSFILPPEEYERVSSETVIPRFAGCTAGTGSAPKLFDERRRGSRRTRDMEIKLMTGSSGVYITGIVEVEGAYAPEKGADAGHGKRETFIGSQGVIFDITKYKKAEFERLELHKKLSLIQRMDAIGKLSGRVAHDLNNKLGSIIGTAELIKQDLKKTDPATIGLYIDMILSASKHAAELSNRLSVFSRKRESPVENLNFHNLLNSVLGFTESIASSSVSVRKLLLSKSPTVTGSETLLQNAMLNLVVNAFDAMKNGGGTLTIETSDVIINSPLKTTLKSMLNPGEYILVSVQDTGVGMSDAVKKRLFEPFFTTDTEKGLGLGLVSIRECIRNHGGAMDMMSEPGRGSQFDIYLPKAEE